MLGTAIPEQTVTRRDRADRIGFAPCISDEAEIRHLLALLTRPPTQGGRHTPRTNLDQL